MRMEARAVPRYVPPPRQPDPGSYSIFAQALNRGRVSQIKRSPKPQPQQHQFERGRPVGRAATREDEDDEGTRNQRPKRAASVTATAMIRSFGKSGGM